MRMKKLLNKYRFGIIAIFISIIVAILFCVSKRDFHVDEALTFALSNSTSGWVDYNTYGWQDKETWLAYVASSTFNYKNVFFNQYFDVHPPLYYCLIHTISPLFQYRFSIWFGLLPNLMFYILNLLLIYYIVYKFSKNDFISSLSILLYGLNKQVLNNVIFIRMYMMSSFFVLLFLLFAIRIINKEGNKYTNLIILFITVICGGLTHYQFYMIIASISLFTAICLITQKRWKDLILSFISVLLAGLLNIFVIFKGTLYHLSFINSDTEGRHVNNAINALKTIGINKDKLSYFINNSWGGYFIFVLSIFIFILLLVLIIKKKDRKYLLPAILLASYLLGFIIIVKTSDLYSYRYLSHLETLDIIGIVLSLYILTSKFNNHISILILVGLIVLNVDLSLIINNINTIPSWEYAKNHQDDKAIILTDEYTTDDEINVLFTNLMWYKQTGISQLDKDFPLEQGEYILYIEKSLDEDDSLGYIKNQFKDNKGLKINKQDIINEEYYIYKINFN